MKSLEKHWPLLVLLVGITFMVIAAAPDMANFNTNQFATSGQKIGLKTGVTDTNQVLWGAIDFEGNPTFNQPVTNLSNVKFGVVQQSQIDAIGQFFGPKIFINTEGDFQTITVTGLVTAVGGIVDGANLTLTNASPVITQVSPNTIAVGGASVQPATTGLAIQYDFTNQGVVYNRGLSVAGTVDQGGSGRFDLIFGNLVENTLGSGPHNLLRLGTAGNDMFKLDDAGNLSLPKILASVEVDSQNIHNTNIVYSEAGFQGNQVTLTNAPAQMTFGTTTNKIYSSSGSNDVKIASSRLVPDIDASNGVVTLNAPLVLSNSYSFNGQIASGAATNAAGSRVAYLTDIAGGSGTGPFTNTITWGDKFNTNAWYVNTNMLIGTNMVLLLTNVSGQYLTWTNGSLTFNGYISGGGSNTTNTWYFGSALTTGTNVALLLTNVNGASLYYTPANGLTVSNSAANASVANFLYSDNLQTNFFVESKFGIMHTNSQGFWIVSNDGMLGSNRVQNTFYLFTNGTEQISGTISAGGAINSTNSFAIGALLSITSSDGHQMRYAYLTNGMYMPTNAVTVNAGVCIFNVDMTNPCYVVLSATNVQVTGFTSISNTVLQTSSICVSNASGTNYNVVWPGGTKIMGDQNSTNAATVFIPSGKLGWYDVKIIGGWTTNVTAYYQR